MRMFCNEWSSGYLNPVQMFVITGIGRNACSGLFEVIFVASCFPLIESALKEEERAELIRCARCVISRCNRSCRLCSSSTCAAAWALKRF